MSCTQWHRAGRCVVPCYSVFSVCFDPYHPAAYHCRLLPGVEDVAQNVADPECRSVASKAHATLLKVGADGKVTGIVANEAEVLAQLGSAIATADSQVGEVVVKYVASLLCGLINASQYKDDQWIEVCMAHVALACCDMLFSRPALVDLEV